MASSAAGTSDAAPPPPPSSSAGDPALMTCYPVTGALSTLLSGVSSAMHAGGGSSGDQRPIVVVLSLSLPPGAALPLAHQPSTRVSPASTPSAVDLSTSRPTDDVNSEEQQLASGADRPRRHQHSSESSCSAWLRRQDSAGKSKSPKSYWLRRHSDSVYAGDDDDDSEDGRTLAGACSPPAASSGRDAAAGGKNRAASSTDTLLASSDPPQACSPSVRAAWPAAEPDDVFDEPAHHPGVVWPPHSIEPAIAPFRHVADDPPRQDVKSPRLQESLGRGRLTVVSADLDDIAEEQTTREDSVLDASGEDAALMDCAVKVELDDADDALTSSYPESGISPMSCSPADPDEPGSSPAVQRSTEAELLVASCRTLVEPRRRGGAGRAMRHSTPGGLTRAVHAESEPSHTGRAHHCHVCRRTFSRSDMLERHARLHSGIRPYACRLCGQVFSRSDHLTTHLRTHTGEKPYSCPRCAYTASRRDMVTRHLRVHQPLAAAAAVTTVSNLPAAVVAAAPARRRTYRSRYKDRVPPPPRATADRDVDTVSPAAAAARTLSAGGDLHTARFSNSWPELYHRCGAVPPTVDERARLLSVPVVPSEPSPVPAPALYRRRLPPLHALQRAVIARGSTGSTDSYSSPGCLSAGGAGPGDVFEFAVEGSPDVFRSPASARQSTVFLWPYPTSTASQSADQRHTS